MENRRNYMREYQRAKYNSDASFRERVRSRVNNRYFLNKLSECINNRLHGIAIVKKKATGRPKSNVHKLKVSTKIEKLLTKVLNIKILQLLLV